MNKFFNTIKRYYLDVVKESLKAKSDVMPQLLKTQKIQSSGLFHEQIKETQLKYKQHLLMCRVGDFYEFYHADCTKVSQLLNLKIAKIKYKNENVFFCGFPAFKMNDYVRLLLEKGHSVARYEQYEKKQGNGERVIVRRVDRIYTKGTVVEEDLLNIDVANVLSIFRGADDKFGFSFIDLGSGQFYVGDCLKEELKHKIASINPIEIIYPSDDSDLFNVVKEIYGESDMVELSGVSRDKFDFDLAENYLNKICYPQGGKQLSAYTKNSLFPSTVSSSVKSASGALLDYLVESHDGVLPLLDFPQVFKKDVVEIDTETRRSLELMSRMRNEFDSSKSKRGSLFHLLDNCITPLGTKELISRFNAPSSSISLLNSYLDLVDYFKSESNNSISMQRRNKIEEVMKNYLSFDVNRAIQNLRLAHGGVWHIGVIYMFLKGVTDIRSLLERSDIKIMNRLLQKASLSTFDEESFKAIENLSELLRHVLPEDFVNGETALSFLPKSVSEPGFIRVSCHPQLQEAADFYNNSLYKKKELEFNIKTVINHSKDIIVSLSHKKPLGPFIEIEASKAGFPEVPTEFHHLQTLSGQGKTVKKRYRYMPWLEMHHNIETAHDLYFEAEKQSFQFVCEQLYKHRDLITKLAKVVAHVDLSINFAKLATNNNYVRPVLVNEPILEIRNGRHPVVEQSLLEEQKSFVSNDSLLKSKDYPQIVLLTGANMGGKSTYLRQNALISIMAHIGCFVPAEYAKIGRIDKVFSRLGTSDDVGRHQSSFMVEMMETAFILKHATANSLIIMDEVGRGTSWKDGSAIAYGVLEYIKNLGSRCLFATHYEDVASEYKKDFDKIKCMRVVINETHEKPIFTYGIEEGVANNVYGLYVATLAGIPEAVTQHAKNWQNR